MALGIYDKDMQLVKETVINIMKCGVIFKYLSNYITLLLMNKLFKALNDQTRREILELLKEGDLTAGDIADKFNISKPSISHHLDLLKQANLVTSSKQGQFISYSINTTVIDEILTWLLQFTDNSKTK